MHLISILVSIVPSIALLVYAYKKDRVDKEPVGLIVLLVIMGAVSCFPASIIESGAIGINDSIFMRFGEYDYATETLYLEGPIFHVASLIENFVCIALIEELCKFTVLFLVTRKERNFNSLFDGLIYAVSVGIGFEILENIFYATDGFGTAILRATMPGHFFFAIFTGYFYSRYHMQKNAQLTEGVLARMGLVAPGVSRFKPGKYIILAILVPTLIHGMWDYLCSVDSTAAEVLFFIMIIALYIVCFMRIRKVSKEDKHEYYSTLDLLYAEYPGLPVDAVNIAYYNAKFPENNYYTQPR